MNKEKWTLDHFNYALRAAIEKHANKRFLRERNGKLLFNGFWRQGNKQNVCAWLNKATWADAKTGESGGIKDFASIAFNLSLPEFMTEYGPADSQIIEPMQFKPEKVISCDLDDIFKKLAQKRKAGFYDYAAFWLEKVRGIKFPRERIYSGFENITPSDSCYFPLSLQGFVEGRAARNNQLVAPLRGPKSERIENFFFREINFTGRTDPEQKSRLLPNIGGLSTKDGLPLGFGMPCLATEATIVVLCEGFVDTLCVEALLEDHLNIAVIGSPSAKFLPKWSRWLAENTNARLIVISHLDEAKNGQSGIGQFCASKAIETYRKRGKEARYFPWSPFLLDLTQLGIKTAITDIRDVGDVCAARLLHEIDFKQIQTTFLKTLQGGANGR